MAYTLYRLTCTASGKSYIGKAKDLKSRVRRHWSYANNGSRYALHAAMRKYGKDAFILESIGTFETEAAVFREEMLSIDREGTRVPNGYNMTAGGEGMSGNIPSAETRAKRSKSLKGRVPAESTRAAAKIANTGRRASESARAKMSVAGKGKPKSAETRARISEATKGRKRGPLSPEWRKKIGDASRGKKRDRLAVERTAAAHRGMKRSAETRAKMSAFWANRRAQKADEKSRNDGLQSIRDRESRIPADVEHEQ